MNIFQHFALLSTVIITAQIAGMFLYKKPLISDSLSEYVTKHSRRFYAIYAMAFFLGGMCMSAFFLFWLQARYQLGSIFTLTIFLGIISQIVILIAPYHQDPGKQRVHWIATFILGLSLLLTSVQVVGASVVGPAAQAIAGVQIGCIVTYLLLYIFVLPARKWFMAFEVFGTVQTIACFALIAYLGS